MTLVTPRDRRRMPRTDLYSADSPVARRLAREIAGEVRFDRVTRGLYSTDASIYQIRPLGVVLPRTAADVIRTIQIAADEGIPVVPRGAGTSQGGQAIGRGIVIDTSKHLRKLVRVDAERHIAVVEPGIVLDRLNALLRPHGLWFPVDIATASRATLGGMAANNSAGARSIRYGHAVEHIRGIDAVLADGRAARFGPDAQSDEAPAALTAAVREIVAREADELERRIPRVPRHVAGYALHRLIREETSLVDLLVGSEGTLAFFTRLELALAPLPRHRVLGVCHFESLRAALDSVPRIVELEPTAVELVDRTLLQLARDNPAYRPTLDRIAGGDPGALLVVEFAGDEADGPRHSLERLGELLGDHGGAGAVVPAIDPGAQREVWSVRKAGLNIAMSMKGDRKTIAFVEDCAVPLERLAEYQERAADIFGRHGTDAIFYAHASVGCLHVRPAIDVKRADGVRALRGIAEEIQDLVQELAGSGSGEHGDGIVRSEFLERMLGARLTTAFADTKRAFDPDALLNPGRIVDPPRMDDRSLFRYGPEYQPRPLPTALDWSAWGGWSGAVEMCNNNGACRKRDPGVMCPSYRVTKDERDTTRGRANALRLALSGQLGPDALAADELYEVMDLCVGCKGCRHECPTGVDMARMKIEFLHAYRQRHRPGLRDRMVARLPRYAARASRFAALLNLRNRSRGLARLGERLVGIAADRALPEWRRDPFRPNDPNAPPVEESATKGAETGGVEGIERQDVILFADTFTTFFEPENARAAVRVLRAAGHEVRVPPWSGGRPPCCGRTFLNAGLVDEAREELRRLANLVEAPGWGDLPIVGLEPSCLLTLRDELPALMPGPKSDALAARTRMLAEFLDETGAADRLPLGRPPGSGTVQVHGHCHEKAFGADRAVADVLRRVPGLEVREISSGCCGMAGAFGYEVEHHALSMAMGELELLPAVRAAGPDDWLVADGISCRHQIEAGAGRQAVHLARLLEAALETA